MRRLGAVLLLPLLVACAGTRGYPGAERPESEVALVEGAWLNQLGGFRHVRLRAIDGQDRLHDWRNNWYDVQLLPGSYEFDVDYDRSGLVAFAMRHPARLSFAVRAGQRYTIHHDPEAETWYVSEAPIGAEEPGWSPPADAVECERVGADDPPRMRCPLGDAGASGD